MSTLSTIPPDPAQLTPSRLAALIDHTILKPEASQEQIDRLCTEALTWQFATVCVNSSWIDYCAAVLRHSPVRVCAVVGFPLGCSFPASKAEEARRAVAAGAAEIDMVLHVGWVKSGFWSRVEEDIAGVVQAAAPGTVKVILETCLLNDEEKIRACEVARQAGAHFVKTSTGFSNGGATLADIALMRQCVGTTLGVKASGGIRDLEAALAMIGAGANRIGTSSGVAIIAEMQKREEKRG